MRLFGISSIALWLAAVSSPQAVAGPYALLAAQVQANGGALVITANGGLNVQSATGLNAAALSACHVVRAEGVTVTSVQIVTATGRVLLVISEQTTLGGC